MTIESHFNVPEEFLEETKKMIRGLPTLRFIYNPIRIKLFNEYRIGVSGEVRDYNQLSKFLATIPKKGE